MVSLAILKMGTPTLRERSSEMMEFGSKSLCTLIENLKDSMKEHNGVGIAAPQIGVNQRVIVFGFENNCRYPNQKPVPLTVLVNPTLTPLSEETVEDWEGCLSIPGLRGKVPRYLKIRYTGFTETGEKIDRIAEGFHARILQHEWDHLNGILYPDRITDMKNFGFEDILWERIYGKHSK